MEKENCLNAIISLIAWVSAWGYDLTPMGHELILALIQELLESRVSETK